MVDTKVEDILDFELFLYGVEKVSSSQLDIASVDIGNPILGMHSIRELGRVEDHFNVYK